MYDAINIFEPDNGFHASHRATDQAFANTCAPGTANALFLGDGFVRPFRGLTTKGAGTGSRKMLQVGRTWGGIRDIAARSVATTAVLINPANTITIPNHAYSTGLSGTLTTTGGLPAPLALATTYYVIVADSHTIKLAASLSDANGGIAISLTTVGTGRHTFTPVASVTASGSFFQDVGRSLWGIGSGRCHIAGSNVPLQLSSLLKVLIAVSGSYTHPDSGAFTVGLAQPSAPSVGISSNAGNKTNAVSAKIERRRPSTGDRSLASTTSAVVVPAGHKVRVTFPAAAAGQTHWAVFFTLEGFGGVGVHYRAPYLGSLDIPESLVAAGVVDDIPRSIEFDFKDGDLVPEEASFDDYPPPAGTHALRLDNLMFVVGCYSDSVSSPTSSSTGSAISVSKPNHYGSHVPSHLLFLPEPVVDVLARPAMKFGFIACENSIHAVQPVGYRGEELPAAIITTILPDIGIKYADNWTQVKGRLCLYTAEGSLLLMDEQGEISDEFASPIHKFIKGWLPENTKLGYEPRTECITVSNGSITLLYCLKSKLWSIVYLNDFGFSGQILSCVTVERRKIVTLLENGTEPVAYEFDSGSQEAPLAFVSSWQTAPSANTAKEIYEISAALEAGTVAKPVVMMLSQNLFPNYLRNVSVSAGSNVIEVADGDFSARWIGKKVCVFAPGISSNGHYLSGIVQSVPGSDQLALVDAAGAPVLSMVDGENLLAFVGVKTLTRTLTDTGEQHLPSFFPNLINCKSYSIAAWFGGADDSGSLVSIVFSGSETDASRVK